MSFVEARYKRMALLSRALGHRDVLRLNFYMRNKI